MWLRRGVLAGSQSLKEVVVEAEGLEEAIVKELRDPGCPRPRNVSVTARPMFHFVHGAPCVLRQRVLNTHIIVRSMVGKHEIHLVAIDYKSFGQSGENEHYKGTALIVKDRDTKTIHGHIVNEKGVGDGWIVSKLKEDIGNLRCTELVLKGDGEPALVQVMNEVKCQRSHKTILEHPPAYDPMSVQGFQKGFERRIGKRVETSMRS